MTELPHLNSLWVGPKLNYLERLCLASAKAMGHQFTLWSYNPANLEGVPPATDLRDAAEVMPQERLLCYRDTGSIALGANLWRIELLAKGLGCWVDMDFIFLKPLHDNSGYLYGWEHEGRINNAVMLAPANSKMVYDLRTIPQPNRRPPWFGPLKTVQFYWSRLRHGRMELEDYPWGTFSAGLLTYAVRKNKLEKYAEAAEVFHPIRWKDAREVYGPAEEVEAMLSPETRAVHLWHSRLQGLRDSPPPKGSYIAKMCDLYGIDTRAALAA